MFRPLVLEDMLLNDNFCCKGPYTAFLDGVATPGDGATSIDTFNVSLFHQTGLGSDQHSLTMMNQWAGSTPTWFDIDYMLVTSGDGNPR